MKRKSKYTNNESGFILPFTIITVTIVLFALMTLAFLYEREIVMTANIQEQFVIESLFSLAEVYTDRALLKSEPVPANKTYAFPQGNVAVSYHPAPSYYRVFYDIETTKGALYSIYQTYAWTVEQQ